MLFDLRSRRRQTTVRIVYVFLALVMGGGLILVGVGTGGSGGLLNAFTSNGSGGNNTDPLVTKQVKAALKATKADPNSPAAWKSLMTARLEQAELSGNYNSSTGTFTNSGTTILNDGVTAWQHYLKAADDKPTATAAALGKRFYAGTGDYSGMATVYQYIVKLEPKVPGVYTCLAYTSYAGGNSQLGDLAATKAVALSTKLNKLALKQSLAAAKKKVSTAKTDVVSSSC